MKRLTTEQYISRAREIHGNNFDYQYVDYKNAKTKIIIVCKKHNLKHEILPFNHLKGDRCPSCRKDSVSAAQTKRYAMTRIEFIQKAREKFKDQFDYIGMEYTAHNEPINILCIQHGIISVIPTKHLKSKTGCYYCGIALRVEKSKNNFSDLIHVFNKIHENKYTYECAIYKNMHTKIEITCPKHGSFWQCPDSHRQCGCPHCANEFRVSRKEKDWLDSLDVPIRQYFINIDKKKYLADGFDKKTNTIYEFYGDYWHGNPKRFSPSDLNLHTNIPFGQMYDITMSREQEIIDAGYLVISIWENDWDDLNSGIV